MIKESTKKKKLLIEFIITLLFFGGSLYYISHKDLRTDLRMTVWVKSSHVDKFQVHVDQKKPLIVDYNPSETGDFQPLVFPLPPKKIKNLKLTLGENKGTVIIEKIALTSPVNYYEWKGRTVKQLVRNTHDVGKIRSKGDDLYLNIKGAEPFVIFSDTFCRFIDDAGSKKTIYYLLTPLLSLFFFYLLHFINPAGSLLFLDRRVFKNLSFVFLVLLFIPIMDGLFHLVPKSQLVEKRKIARKPAFRLDSLSTYPELYTAYYNDHFTARGHLIFQHSLLKYKIFGLSSVPRVVAGKAGWLYMGKTVVRHGTLEYFRNIRPFTMEELEEWKKLLEHRYQWLEARGIRYLFVIAPNKNTIYPEYMPANIRKVHPYSRMDQLVDYLKKHSSVHLADLRPALLEAKKHRPVYSRTDTHWNDYGAYIAYREIMMHISRYFKQARPMPLSRFKIKIVDSAGGDLAQMLSLHLEVMRENMVQFSAVPPLQARGEKLENLAPFVRCSYRERKDAPLPNIIMVHDSFYQKLKPFLSEHFSRVLYIWDWNMNFYPSVIKSEKPVLVIDEMAERFLYPLNQ